MKMYSVDVGTKESVLNVTEVLRTLKKMHPETLGNILATIDLADDAYDESFKIINLLDSTEPIVRSHVTVCDNCGSSSIGYDALVNDDNELVAGPYDNAQCLYCGDEQACTRKIPIAQTQSCGNGKDCDHIGTFYKKVLKGGLCPKCANPLPSPFNRWFEIDVSTELIWNPEENNNEF
jgi:hypothetical protein